MYPWMQVQKSKEQQKEAAEQQKELTKEVAAQKKKTTWQPF
jgi:hypothetical protein